MEVSSLKKKFKDKKFAAGCSRDVITKGAGNLGWELPKLMEMTDPRHEILRGFRCGRDEEDGVGGVRAYC